jgi:ABC-type phosphate/phosphonate transport system substrate-binding protein
MAITYKWTINQMNAHIQAEGEDNVIFTVHWTYSGSEDVSGKIYSASQIGAQSFTYVKGDPFVPYADTEAFENVVIGWLEGALDVSSMQSSIEATIQKEITPVNEDLYFTWQNPPAPPVPPVEE